MNKVETMTINIKQRIMILLCLFLSLNSVLPVMADDVNINGNAKEILMNSLLFSQKATYEGTLENPFPIKVSNFIPPALMKVKSTDNCTSLFYSSFELQELGKVEVMINPDGRYLKIDKLDWIGKMEISDPKGLDFTAMISNFDKVNKLWYDLLKNNDSVKYSLNDTTYDSKNCVKITATVSPTDNFIQQITKLSAQQIAQIGKDKILENLPLLLTFTIDSTTDFCYSIEFFSNSGTALASIKWSDVIIQDISDKDFYPSDDSKIIVFTNQEELTQKVIESRKLLTQDELPKGFSYSVAKKIIIYTIIGIILFLVIVIAVIKINRRS